MRRIVLLALVFAFPVPALAQPVLTATLTVGSRSDDYGTSTGYRDLAKAGGWGYGSMTPTVYTRGTSSYDVAFLYVFDNATVGVKDTLNLGVKGPLHTLPSDWVLTLDGRPYRMATAEQILETYQGTGTFAIVTFSETAPSWTDGDTVALTLGPATDAVPAVPLFGLAVLGVLVLGAARRKLRG